MKTGRRPMLIRAGRKVRIGPLLAILAAGSLLAAVAPVHSDPVADQAREQQARGRTSYRLHCASCHGKAGHGDGPAADALRTPPADLTRIAAHNGDRFPRDQVIATIDGRTVIGSHGPREMPVWGWSFLERERDLSQSEAIEMRIRDIVAYIESIQRPSGDDPPG